MTGRAEDADGPRWRRLAVRAGRQPIFILGLVIVVLSLISGLATYLILTGLTPIVPTHMVVVTVLLINGMLAAAVILLIAWQVSGLWRARRRQAAGSRLHTRIVGLFSIIAVLPAILLAVFASISLDRGLDHWFSSRTKSIIDNSLNVATAYLAEHGQVIRSDVVGMAADIDEAAVLARMQPQSFGKFLSVQASIRDLPQAYLIDATGRLMASAGSRQDAPYEPPPANAIEAAKDGTAVVISPGQTNKVGAIKRLENFAGTYLYIVRTVNPQVLAHLRATRARVEEYEQLEERRAGVQVAFGLMYVAIALTLLLAAMWLGLWFANRLVAPIRQLIAAAQQVSEGDLDTRVEADAGEGDLGQLGATFNTMTSELRSQRDELVSANTKLDERRGFMEAVMSGVSAGVIGVDAQGVVTLANPSAVALLNAPLEDLVGRSLDAAVPELGPLLKQARSQGNRLVDEQIKLVRDGQERSFAVRVTSERAQGKSVGHVVTFDDVTELVQAQRTSAWADVARRIAHEIKNPLTPIQLSAERLRRKYGASIVKDREIFDQCTDTIIRQVGDIGRMVDEFSAFARMPKAVMESHDLREVVRESVFLFQVSHPEVDFEVDVPAKPVVSMCDRRLMAQALTNLVKNAGEAIETATGGAPPDYRGAVTVRVRAKAGRFTVDVIDNGCGLPTENRSRLVEPYMTTREKGTGLGLAIVQKIVEQHGGVVELRDAPKRNGKSRGACVRLDLPVLSTRASAAATRESASTASEAPGPAEALQGVSHGV